MQKTTVERQDIQDYYGKVLQTKADLKTSACCSTEDLPPHIKEILATLDDEILAKFYGCGSPIPESLEGCTVLDLGCGTGRDAFVVSKLVGENGRVIGIDMTKEQLEVARKYRDSTAQKFGYRDSNVQFLEGYIEELGTLGIESNSIDLVISNCVVNLSFDKHTLLSEIFRVLKPGGELYFSDVFLSRRVPAELKNDPILIGECIAGAFYLEDFRRAMTKAGCLDYRVVSSRPIEIQDPEVEKKIGPTQLYSQTIRAFQLDSLEDCCEDYGQVATYLGSIPENPHTFRLDDHHIFEAGRPMLVCGNTAAMLEESRYARHFEVRGNREKHFGLFDCAPSPGNDTESNAGGCC